MCPGEGPPGGTVRVPGGAAGLLLVAAACPQDLRLGCGDMVPCVHPGSPLCCVVPLLSWQSRGRGGPGVVSAGSVQVYWCGCDVGVLAVKCLRSPCPQLI